MAVLEKTSVNTEVEALFADMEELRAAVAQVFVDLGIEYDPNVTAEEVREAMRAEGIRAEDNEFSRGIIAAREE